MAEQRLQYIRYGLRTRDASVKLRLRWDRSPKSCAALVDALPIEGPAFHGKYANYEVYALVPMVAAGDPGPEWKCIYPGPGDLMFIPVYPGALLPPGAPEMDPERGILDIAFWYERGNCRVGPGAPGSATSWRPASRSPTSSSSRRRASTCGCTASPRSGSTSKRPDEGDPSLPRGSGGRDLSDSRKRLRRAQPRSAAPALFRLADTIGANGAASISPTIVPCLRNSLRRIRTS